MSSAPSHALISIDAELWGQQALENLRSVHTLNKESCMLIPWGLQFINLVSKSHLAISDGLRSCTKTVQLGDAFDLDGRSVVLVDTPGFDDTTMSDTDILKMIAVYLASTLARLSYDISPGTYHFIDTRTASS